MKQITSTVIGACAGVMMTAGVVTLFDQDLDSGGSGYDRFIQEQLDTGFREMLQERTPPPDTREVERPLKPQWERDAALQRWESSHPKLERAVREALEVQPESAVTESRTLASNRSQRAVERRAQITREEPVVEPSPAETHKAMGDFPTEATPPPEQPVVEPEPVPEQTAGLAAAATAPTPSPAPASAEQLHPGEARRQSKLAHISRKIEKTLPLVFWDRHRRGEVVDTTRVRFKLNRRGYIRDYELVGAVADAQIARATSAAVRLAEPYRYVPGWIEVQLVIRG